MRRLALCAVMVVVGVVAYVTPDHDKRAKSKSIDHHSLHPPHLRNTIGAEDVPFWSYSGATVVTDTYIRLTPDKQSSIGMVWNTEPLDLPAWEVVLGFRVHSKSGFGADGMALWIVDDIPTKRGGLFGHPHEFHGIGVVFDSYDNDRYRDNPAVHVLYNAVGENKDFNTQQDFRGQSSGNCYFDYRNTPKPALATARLRYQDNTLQLFMSKNSERDEVLCTTVTGVELTKGTYFLGVTAETGGISDNHDVHFLHMYPIAGYHYDHDVYEHEPYSHHSESDQKKYWRAKTPEEEEAERQEKKEREEREREEREKRRREAEESNQREVERRRVLALEKELDEMRKKATEQESAYQDIQRQRERHARETKAEEAASSSEDPAAAQPEDVHDEASQPEDASQPEEASVPEREQVRPRVPVRPKQQPLKRPGKGPLPPRRK